MKTLSKTEDWTTGTGYPVTSAASNRAQFD